MGEPIRVIRAGELVSADPTAGMLRMRAFELPILWAGKVITDPGAISGWHHHDKNESSLYIVSGVLRCRHGDRDLVLYARGVAAIEVAPRGAVL